MLQRLKEFKEVIALVVFFLGGFFWIESEYPKRKDLEVLECLLNEYMTLTQLQIRAQDLEDEVAKLTQSLSDPMIASAGEAISPVIAAMLADRQKEIDQHEVDLRGLERRMVEISERLQRHDCGRVTG